MAKGGARAEPGSAEAVNKQLFAPMLDYLGKILFRHPGIQIYKSNKFCFGDRFFLASTCLNLLSILYRNIIIYKLFPNGKMRELNFRISIICCSSGDLWPLTKAFFSVV